ncbi:hypothetical protein B0H13DRAFT_1891940 [Mycena leptocephala]|nr:hypothetical protein B0H13DRAFT_1891940 [Mycena leptocephala]
MKVNKKPKENIYRTLLNDKQQNQYSFETEEKTYDIMATATGGTTSSRIGVEAEVACPAAGDARNASSTRPNTWGIEPGNESEEGLAPRQLAILGPVDVPMYGRRTVFRDNGTLRWVG